MARAPMAFAFLAAASLAAAVGSLTCESQDCEDEANSLLSTRRAGVPLIVRPDPSSLDDVAPDVNSSTFTPANADDDVEVYWMTAPLEGIPLLGAENLYHVGIGFINKRSAMNTTSQFYADTFGIGLLLPTVNESDRTWNLTRPASIHTTEKINETYWNKVLNVLTITGSAYNEYIRKLDDLHKIDVNYVLFTVAPLGQYLSKQQLPHLPGASAGPLLPPGSKTCMDVAAELLGVLKSLPGTQSHTRPQELAVYRDDMYLWMAPNTSVRKLNVTRGNPDYNIVFDFFSAIDKVLAGAHHHNLFHVFHDLKLAHGLDYAIFADMNDEYWQFTPHVPLCPLGWNPDCHEYWVPDHPMYKMSYVPLW